MSDGSNNPEGRELSGMREFWYYFSRNKGAVLGLAVFALVAPQRRFWHRPCTLCARCAGSHRPAPPARLGRRGVAAICSEPMRSAGTSCPA